MSPTVQLWIYDDYYLVSTVVDLSPWLADGWEPAIGQPGAAFADEAIPLHVPGSDVADLSDQLRTITNLIDSVDNGLRAHALRSVWLNVYLTGESGGRLAQVLRLELPDSGQLAGLFIRHEHILPNLTLGIRRGPWWESAVADASANIAVAANGGNAVLASSVAADGGGRFSVFELIGGGNYTLTDVWIGLRSDRFGLVPANFIALWSLRLASYYGADTTGGTTNADATAIDGYKVICTFATTAAMAVRAIMTVANTGTTHYQDFRGRYAVIARAKVTGTAVCYLRIGSGFYNAPTTDFSRLSLEEVSGTGWKKYNLGEIELPPGRTIAGALQYAAVLIEAMRYSGSGNLEIDTLELIPVDEASLTVSGCLLNSTNHTRTHLYGRPDGSISGVNVIDASDGFDPPGSESPIGSVAPRADRWGLPRGSSRIIVSAQRSGLSVKGDTLAVRHRTALRHMLLRGDL